MIDQNKCALCGRALASHASTSTWRGDGWICGKCAEHEGAASNAYDELESALSNLEPYIESRAAAARMLSKVLDSPAFKELVKAG